jgi:pyruvate dehydrogenase E1 component alpha subunit
MNKYKLLGSKKRVSDLNSSELEVLERELVEFEDSIVDLWEAAKIPYPVHLSGGNERQVINCFKEVKTEDYVLSTHRGHYHYLLKGGSPQRLTELIMEGDSMHLFEKNINFMTSSIVAGMPAIAVGLARAIRDKKKSNHVWCFVGDGAEDEGHFYEAVRYADGHRLPCTFIIEDNNRSVETPKSERYGDSVIPWPLCVRRYFYEAKYPHVGTGKLIKFGDNHSSGEVGATLT